MDEEYMEFEEDFDEYQDWLNSQILSPNYLTPLLSDSPADQIVNSRHWADYRRD